MQGQPVFARPQGPMFGSGNQNLPVGVARAQVQTRQAKAASLVEEPRRKGGGLGFWGLGFRDP